MELETNGFEEFIEANDGENREFGEMDIASLQNTENGQEADLPPEFCHYKDEGCELSESCLNCPFIRCIYDAHGGKQRRQKKKRAKEIVRLRSEGKKIRELAHIFGLSARTVHRDLKRTSRERKTK